MAAPLGPPLLGPFPGNVRHSKLSFSPTTRVSYVSPFRKSGASGRCRRSAARGASAPRARAMCPFRSPCCAFGLLFVVLLVSLLFLYACLFVVLCCLLFFVFALSAHLGRHYSSNAACLIRPRLFSTARPV